MAIGTSITPRGYNIDVTGKDYTLDPRPLLDAQDKTFALQRESMNAVYETGRKGVAFAEYLGARQQLGRMRAELSDLDPSDPLFPQRYSEILGRNQLALTHEKTAPVAKMVLAPIVGEAARVRSQADKLEQIKATYAGQAAAWAARPVRGFAPQRPLRPTEAEVMGNFLFGNGGVTPGAAPGTEAGAGAGTGTGYNNIPVYPDATAAPFTDSEGSYDPTLFPAAGLPTTADPGAGGGPTPLPPLPGLEESVEGGYGGGDAAPATVPAGGGSVPPPATIPAGENRVISTNLGPMNVDSVTYGGVKMSPVTPRSAVRPTEPAPPGMRWLPTTTNMAGGAEGWQLVENKNFPATKPSDPPAEGKIWVADYNQLGFPSAWKQVDAVKMTADERKDLDDKVKMHLQQDPDVQRNAALFKLKEAEVAAAKRRYDLVAAANKDNPDEALKLLPGLEKLEQEKALLGIEGELLTNQKARQAYGLFDPKFAKQMDVLARDDRAEQLRIASLQGPEQPVAEPEQPDITATPEAPRSAPASEQLAEKSPSTDLDREERIAKKKQKADEFYAIDQAKKLAISMDLTEDAVINAVKNKDSKSLIMILKEAQRKGIENPLLQLETKDELGRIGGTASWASLGFGKNYLNVLQSAVNNEELVGPQAGSKGKTGTGKAWSVPKVRKVEAAPKTP